MKDEMQETDLCSFECQACGEFYYHEVNQGLCEFCRLDALEDATLYLSYADLETEEGESDGFCEKEREEILVLFGL